MKSNLYMVYGTLKGKVIPSMAWQVHSFLGIEEFTKRFESIAPEYTIVVYYDDLYEMQIVSAIEIKQENVMTIYSHTVMALNHDTGDISIDDETLEAGFPDGDFFDSESNIWMKYRDVPSEWDARDKELRKKLEASIEAYNILSDIHAEIIVGDGEMSYEMYVKVCKFFGTSIEDSE